MSVVRVLSRGVVPWVAAASLIVTAAACVPDDNGDEAADTGDTNQQDAEEDDVEREDDSDEADTGTGADNTDGDDGDEAADIGADNTDGDNADEAADNDADNAVGDNSDAAADSDTFTTEPLEVDADGLTLEGTLYLPTSQPQGGIVIAHGSGPFSREGIMPGQLGLTLPEPIAVYTELAKAFAQSGYVTATFDKRTCSPANGCGDNSYPAPQDDLTFDHMVDDAGAVVDAIAAREDVDEVAVVGHSKGGTVAAHLADSHELSAAVLLGTPVQSIDVMLRNQARTLWELAEDGPTAPAAMTEATTLTNMADAIAAVADGDIEGNDISGTSRMFWASWLDASAIAPGLLDRSEVPALALGGTIDWNVPAEEVDRWAQVVDDIEIVTIDGMAHTLSRVHKQDPDEITEDDLEVRVAPDVVDTVVDFLRQRT